MFKAGRRIIISHNELISINGEFISPKINLLGLELFASTPLPECVEDFLKSKRIDYRVDSNETGQVLILSGSFILKKQEVEAFLESHKAEMQAYSQSILEPELSDTALKHEIETSIESVHSPILLETDAGTFLWQPEILPITTENVSFNNSDLLYFNKSQLKSDGDINISTPKYIHSGHKMGEVGVFANLLSKQNVTITAHNSTFENTRTQACDSVIIFDSSGNSENSEGSMRASISDETLWVNKF